MQPPKLTYDNRDFVLKKDACGAVLIGLLVLSMLTISLFFGESTQTFFKGNHLATAVCIVAIVTATFFLIRSGLANRNRVTLIICKDGIWTAKRGLIKWSVIQYYFFAERKGGRYPGKSLKIKMFDIDELVSIDISLFNQDEQNIQKAIKYNSGDNNVMQLLRDTMYQ